MQHDSGNAGPSKPRFRFKKSLGIASAALVTTLTIAEKAVDGVPAPGLKAAVGGLLELVKAIKKTRENDNDIKELDDHLKDLSDILNSISDKKETDDPLDLDNRIARLTSDIKKIVESCGSIRSQPALMRFFSHPDNASAISGINRSIERAIRTFQLGGNISVEQGIADIKLHLKRVADVTDPLIALRPYIADARYDSASRAGASRCFDGTRTDILQNIYDWVDDPNSKAIYWLCGLAGTGKSTIAQTVAGVLNERKVLGGSFFFSRDVAERSNPLLVFTTLAYQLGRFDESFCYRIADSLNKHPDVCTSILQTQLETLIVEPLREVVRAPPVVVLILDALDECSNGPLVKEMLSLLASAIPKLPFSMHVFITSRPDIHIRSQLHGSSMKSVSEVTLLHDIDMSVVQNDIKTYLRYHLQKIGEEMLADGDWPSQADLDLIVEQARGLFVYASASVAYIGDIEYLNPNERLRALLSEKVNSGESCFVGIDKLYSRIIHSTIRLLGSRNTAQRLRGILGVILMLLNPLTIPAIEKLASINDVRPMLIPLHSVLSGTDDPEKPIRVFHRSFIDFMLNPQRCTDSSLYIDPNTHHTRLARQCLSHMNSGLRRNMCGIQDPFALNSEIPDLDVVLRTEVGPHLIYACCFWAFHLEHADPTDQMLRNAVSLFSTTALLYWLEILSLSMRLPLANQSLKIAQGWYKEEQSMSLTLVRKAIPVSEHLGILRQPLRSAEERLLTNTPTKNLLHDCERFVLRFVEVISDSARHIYHSALPFTPKSLFYEKYKDELKGSAKVSQMEDAWDPLLSVLHGHSDRIQSVCFSPDGSRVVSGSYDHTIRLWDSNTGSHIRTLEGHGGRVQSVCFSPDGTMLASGSDDRTLCLWDSSTGERLKTMGGSSFGKIWSVSFSPDGSTIVVGSDDCLVHLWDSNTGEHIRALEGHKGRVQSVSFSPDGLSIVSGSSDCSIRLWNPTTGGCIRTVKGHYQPVSSVSFSPDGSRIVSGSDDRTVRLWESSTGNHITTLEGHSGKVQSVCFSPDGLMVASGSLDHTVQLWSSNTGSHIKTLDGHSGWICSICFSPDGSRMASGCGDHSVCLWDPTFVAYGKATKKHSGRVRSMCVSPDGTRIASGSDDRTVCLWDSTTGDHISTLEGHSDSVQSVCFLSNGTYIQSHDSKGKQIVWDSRTLGPCLNQDVEPILEPENQGGQSIASPLCEARGDLFLDERWVIFRSQTHSQYRICLLPVLDITAHVAFVFRLAFGTRSGYVQVLDFSDVVGALT